MLYKNLNVWSGAEENIFFGDIYVQGDRFEQGGSKQRESKDFSGCFAIPGLIDSHIHLCLDPSEKDPMKQESNKEKLRASMISRAESMVSWNHHRTGFRRRETSGIADPRSDKKKN